MRVDCNLREGEGWGDRGTRAVDSVSTVPHRMGIDKTVAAKVGRRGTAPQQRSDLASSDGSHIWLSHRAGWVNCCALRPTDEILSAEKQRWCGRDAMSCALRLALQTLGPKKTVARQ